MDVVMIFNGLGNQMSQYAFYLAKKHLNPEVKYCCLDNDHNGYELDRLFGIRKKSKYQSFHKKLKLIGESRRNKFARAIRKFLNWFGINFIIEQQDYKYQSKLLESQSGNNIYIGGWHNFRYFDYIRAEIIQTFTFNNRLLNKHSVRILEEIRSKNSVAIHIRRGDYLKAENSGFADICTEQYYKTAIAKTLNMINAPHFFIFSNDPQWVAEHYKLQSFTIVDCNSGVDSWMDMYLMSQCKGLIIANSTFSWWAAYLSNANFIIRPPKFNQNPSSAEIYPTNWVNAI